ncbi:MAG: hypothetical protein KAH93_04185 [Candidatus Aenigmarchaeota archaeon]|nr:hypothetical protein [Candidatus Aenigmarchaeota archaeon]
MLKMNGFLVLMVIGVVLASGCARPESAPQADEVLKEVTGIEEIGGKYNLTLVDTEVTVGNRSSSMKMIRYVKDGVVVEPDMMLPDYVRPGLDWIRENTLDDVVVFCWWDHGHMIRAYGMRDVVVDGPSREILVTTVSKYVGMSVDEIECPDCVSHDVILDVSGALLGEDSKGLLEVMDKYGASVFYVQNKDADKSFAFYASLGEEPKEPDSEEFLGTVAGRGARAEEIDGLELAYSDEVARVYLVDE